MKDKGGIGAASIVHVGGCILITFEGGHVLTFSWAGHIRVGGYLSQEHPTGQCDQVTRRGSDRPGPGHCDGPSVRTTRDDHRTLTRTSPGEVLELVTVLSGVIFLGSPGLPVLDGEGQGVGTSTMEAGEW